MSNTIYLQLDENIEVQHPLVYLQDIAKLSCPDAELLHRLRILPVLTLNPERPGRYVMSVMDLLTLIQKKEPNLTITPLGPPDFIITYIKKTESNFIRSWLKVFFVCLISFFGAAFSIMTFNTDVDVGRLFSQIYTQVTGLPSSGFTILEISYSIGLGLGVLFFFNHFGKMKITSDPTPMQIQMRLYENDVNTTIIEDKNRKQTNYTHSAMNQFDIRSMNETFERDSNK